MSISWIAIAADFALAFVFPQASIRSGRTALFFIGIGRMYAGMTLRLYSMIVLGGYFTYQVAVHTDQPVIEKGSYLCTRHPSYTGELITVVGLGLAPVGRAVRASRFYGRGITPAEFRSRKLRQPLLLASRTRLTTGAPIA